jgi:hypothetical protein
MQGRSKASGNAPLGYHDEKRPGALDANKLVADLSLFLSVRCPNRGRTVDETYIYVTFPCLIFASSIVPSHSPVPHSFLFLLL